MEWERISIAEAARRLGITESAVRKRASRGQIRSERVTEGKRERLYILLDPEVDIVQEPFRERYMRSLEDRVRTLEEEVMRQQAIILSMSQSMQALTAPSEPSESPADERDRGEPPSSTTGAEEGVSKRRQWWRRWFSA